MEESRVREIRSAVETFRKAIERSDLSSDEFYLKTFPRVCCKPASMVLGKYLVDEVGCRPLTFVEGKSWGHNGGLLRSHWWIEHEGLVIDITADQFAEIEQPVIVTTDLGWYEQFAHLERYSYSETLEIDTLEEVSSRVVD